MSSILYFSYGSNMSLPRLLQRVPSAQLLSVAYLSAHKLQFHKKGHDGSAKCDIEFTNCHTDIVYGVVYTFLASEKPYLDLIEGLGKGYNEKSISAVGLSGEIFQSVTYYATDIDPSLKPYHWYKEHVVRGAREHNLPIEYIRALQMIVSVADPDPLTHHRELSIYKDQQ